ncbi:hypothetical protein SEVIR_7G314900v4 [Setaria viridis]|uniref:Cytochrome P450 n=2 Tax=Setaria viridis TaxID=4556 RepID=A0A4U6TWP8_SETVI|nr:cytochrome P450 714C2-like [Setaria viridis]TKW07558.1 hypothetical protein SEVIR_7G314900v2 [Setaria viridis]
MELVFSSHQWLILPPLVLLCLLLSYLYTILWLRPERLRQKLRSQGVKGPKPSFLFGNIAEMRRIQKELAVPVQELEAKNTDKFSSDYTATIFPYFLHWSRIYGSIYLYSTGSIQALNITDPDMVKELANCKSLDLGKPSFLQKERGALLGMGILTSNGELWEHQRKVIAPEFFMEKVKGMLHIMVEAAMPMLTSWENILGREGGSAEIVVDESLRNFSADVISRTSFGSNFAAGKEIFNKIRQLQIAMAKQNILGVPGARYLPTKSNREIWSLDRSIRRLILNVAMKHEQDSVALSTDKDLLHSIIKGAKARHFASQTPEGFIIDNCKNIYFAGHETTSTTAAWCLMLLASHPEWQSRSRTELLDVCQGKPIEFDMLRKLKMLTMVVQETLRLYPPAAFVTREALNDIKLGSLNIPEGTNIRIPIALVHRDPAIWGPNSDRFDPGRFANGIAGACKPPHMYMPFGVGTRTCAGQNLAMVELKVILSLLLSRFEFALSPKYVHCPAFRLTIEPGNGVPLILKKLY